MSKKLLLADDSITIQKVIGITFAHEDYQLTVVDNGDAALEKARALHPDLVLADVFMPGKNGYELCAAIKQDAALRSTPILLLTGTFEPFDEEKAKAAGADSWIAKPFESQALIDRVEGLLAKGGAAAPAAPPAEPAVKPAAAAPSLAVPAGQPAAPAVEPAKPAPAAFQEPIEEIVFETGPVMAPTDEVSLEPAGGDLWGDLAATSEPPPAAVAAAPRPAPAPAMEAAGNPPAGEIWGELDLTQKPASEADDIWGDFGTKSPATSAPAQVSAAADELLAVSPPAGEPSELVFEDDPFALTGDDLTAAAPPLPAAGDWGGPTEEVLPLEEADIIEAEPLDESADSGQFLAEEEPPVASNLPGFPEISFEEPATSAGIAGEIEWEFPAEPPLETFALPEAPPAAKTTEPAPAADRQPSAPKTEPLPSPTAAPLRSAAAPEATAAAVEAKVATLSDEEISRIVEKVAGAVIERVARTMLERIAWEVVPDLAESMIKDEIRKIKEEVKH